MRVASLSCFAVGLLVIGCGGAPATPAAGPPASNGAAAAKPAPVDPAVKAFRVGADSLKADKVGGSDGALKPDGSPDLSFAVELEGPAAAFFLLATNEKGEPNGLYQADTIVGLDELPAGFPQSVKAGMLTAGIGVWEGDKLLSRENGSIAPVGPGLHKLTLYIASTGVLQPGSWVRVYVARTDKSFYAGPTLQL